MKTLPEVVEIIKDLNIRDVAYKSGLSYSSIKKIIDGQPGVRSTTLIQLNRCLKEHYAHTL